MFNHILYTNMCLLAAVWFVHQSGCPHCPAADWTALLLPAQGVLMCVWICEPNREGRKGLFTHPFVSPQAVLACINVTSLRQMLLQFQDLPELWRISRIDFVRKPPLMLE